MLRFDGLYRSAITRDSKGSGYRSHLRFYPDGCVIEATVMEPVTPKQILKWFEPGRPGQLQGKYTLTGNQIELYTVLEFGRDYDGGTYPDLRTDYHGEVTAKGLLLDRRGMEGVVTSGMEFEFKK